jgi:dTDP-4-amino-4,6-dideoxygalactose transaminase
VWHLYVVRLPAGAHVRNRVLAEMSARGVDAGIHYPIPVHLTPAFSYLGYRPGAFPHAVAAAGQILTLPLYPQITATQQRTVVDALTSALRQPRVLPVSPDSGRLSSRLAPPHRSGVPGIADG